jgi:hypothetical protein
MVGKLRLWISMRENCKSGDLGHREEAEKFYRDLAAQGMRQNETTATVPT